MKSKILGLLAVGLLAGPLGANAGTVHLTANLLTTNELHQVVGSNASGTADFYFDTVLNTLDWSINVTGLSGQVTGAHIHSAPATLNGPVVVNFLASLSGTGLAVNPALLQSIISIPGNYYVNVHTALNPMGETRGQLAAVPEPDSFALLALGLAGLGLSRRRKAN